MIAEIVEECQTRECELSYSPVIHEILILGMNLIALFIF